jgi:hypothetical protein
VKRDSCIITFTSTHNAIRFEHEFSNSGIQFDLIPVPREISASCGLAAIISPENAEKIASSCRSSGVRFEAIYMVYANASMPPKLLHTY